jgi:hypothetical protein
MKVYARSLFVGLCAAALVILVCWSAGLIPRIDYTPPAVSRPSSVAPAAGDAFAAATTEEVGTVTVTTAPSYRYVIALAVVALVTASGWQLRRSWRDRPKLKGRYGLF